MLQEMGGLVARSVHRSVFRWSKRTKLRHQVIRDESRIDQMEIQIDDLVASLIVREQPVARDMRLIVAAIRSTRISSAWATWRSRSWSARSP